MTHHDDARSIDVAIVGGGIAGLTAASHAARGGARVVLFERAAQLGGRAFTRIENGFHFNMGAHALYNGGVGAEVLQGMGIELAGGQPDAGAGFAGHAGTLHRFPAGAASLLRTRLLRFGSKLRVGALLARLPRMDARLLEGRSVDSWICESLADPVARDLLRAVVRLSTYCNAPKRLSAAAAVEQVAMAVGSGVTYLDGGWQSLVEGLRRSAEEQGASLRERAAVRGVSPTQSGFALELAEGAVSARRVVLAVAPRDVATLLGGASSRAKQWADAALPARTACLDLALDRLPVPGNNFSLGIDRPFYASVHSGVAKLAPEGKALVQAVKYLDPEQQSDTDADLRELEAWVDQLQPGWRELEIGRQFLPRVVTTTDLVRSELGSTAGRPGPALPDLPGAFVAGDWVGGEGQLAHACLASGRAAGSAAAA